MDTSMLLGSIIGPFYLIMGLSILLYAKQWKKLTGELRKNHFALLGMMFLSLVVGLILIQMHNIWEWNLWVVITITGWGAFLKAVFYFLLPASWTTSALKLGENMTYLYFGGLVTTFFGAWISYVVYLV